MRVFEVGGIFEAVAEHTVDGDVGDPDKGNGDKDAAVAVEAERSEEKGDNVGMGEVISGRSDARTSEVAEHGKVWREEEDREEEPGEVEVGVEDKDGDEEKNVFQFEQESWPREHDLLYGMELIFEEKDEPQSFDVTTKAVSLRMTTSFLWGKEEAATRAASSSMLG
jgi:hypothetical protein